MPEAARLLLGIGALVMAVGVILGALSAHAAKNAKHADAPALMRTAVLYLFVHGLGIFAAGILARNAPSFWLPTAGLLHLAGIVLFCGGMWFLARTGRSPGPIAPLGGLLFIAGWLALAMFAFATF
jgi:uncharacterized membrane protein YgdD (TMEM256/DUF423 family)